MNSAEAARQRAGLRFQFQVTRVNEWLLKAPLRLSLADDLFYA